MLVPRNGAYTASFYEYVEDGDVDIYVDITSIPEWSPAGVTAIDLDLDVVRLASGKTFVDDRDEFDTNQRRYGYPPDVIANAESTCARVMDDITRGSEPYKTVGFTWLAQFL